MWVKDILELLVKNALLIKSKLVLWLNEPRWVNRLTLYFLILLPAVYIIIGFIFSYFGLLHTDVDSARYMLSSLVQSEGAIMAIVITLSLVAVQLAASSYSARVIDIFRSAPDLWILIGIYSFAVFYGLGVLKLVEVANPQLSGQASRPSNLEADISFAYYFGSFAFISLVPYIWNTLEMLKPSTIINMLADRITEQKILSATEKPAKDPILPIIDIVNSALMRYDYETVVDGLNAIGEHTSSIFKSLGYTTTIFKRMGTSEEVKLSENIFDHLTSVGKLAVNRINERAVIATLFSIWSNVQVAIEQKLEIATRWGVESIEELGIEAAGQKLKTSTLTAVQLIGSAGETIAKQSIEEAIFKQELRDTAMVALDALNDIRKVAIEYKLDDAAQQAEDFTKRINQILDE